MMNSLDISNIQRRKPRRSMLGTHRSYGFQLNKKPSAQINEKVSKTNSISASNTNIMPRRPSRKSVQDTRGKGRNNIFSMLLNEPFNSPTSISVNTAEKIDGANDSFEKNETFMMTEVDEDEESGLANFLLDNSMVEVTDVIPHPENDTIPSENANNVILDDTVITPTAQDSTLSDLITLLNATIENNTRTVNRYHNQIDEVKNAIEEKDRQTKDIIELKFRLMKKFHLNECPNEMLLTKLTEPTESKSLKCLEIIPDQKYNFVSSNYVAVPSKQIIHELHSTMKFLKTPRSCKCARQSIMLTPHSMSLSIENQLKKLRE